jgi:multiple sugar transport system permease protein
MTLSKRKQDQITAYIFVVPLLIIIVGLVAYPFVESIILSFMQKYVGVDKQTFVGFDNYVNLIQDRIFRQAFKNTLIWTFATVIFKLILGMCMALILNQRFRMSGIIRGLLLIPWIMPTPISGLVWVWIFNDMSGVLNHILLNLHFIEAPIAWLATGKLALASVISVNLWRGTPFFGITLLAGMKNIPTEQYEAATIDGANKIQSFIYITLPGLRFVLLISTLLESIWAMGDFSIVYIMTQGGPAGATHLISTLTYEIGFRSADLGRAVAVSLFPLPILALLIIGVTSLMDKRKEE